MTDSSTTRVLRPLTADQQETLAVWRATAMTIMPYLSHIVFAFRPLHAPGLQTFACDEQLRLYIDFDHVEKWGAQACAEALLHEAGHVWGQHPAFARDFGIGDEHHRMWNVAGDMSINDDLAEAGCTWIAANGMMPGHIGEPEGQTPKHYFDALSRLARQQQSSKGGQSGRSGGNGPNGNAPSDGGDEQGASQGAQSGDGQDDQKDGNTQSAGGQGEQDGQSQGKGEGGDGDAPVNAPFKGCGSISGGEAAPCELPSGDDADGQAAPASAAEVESIVAATAQAILDHASRSRGTVPGGWVEEARGFLSPPKVSWRQVLGASVRRAVRLRQGDTRADYTKRDRRRNFRVGGKKVIMPGRAAPKIPLAVVRDTSGSMSAAELDRVTSEVVGIAKQLRIKGQDLRILDVDAQTHAVRKFKNAEGMREVSGRGGTDMAQGIEDASELRPRAAAIVVISDGGTPWPAERTKVPVIACLVGPYASDAAAYVPSWIKTIVVEED